MEDPIWWVCFAFHHITLSELCATLIWKNIKYRLWFVNCEIQTIASQSEQRIETNLFAHFTSIQRQLSQELV